MPPAYSIGKVKRNQSLKNSHTTPGVGSYNIQSWKKSSTVKSIAISSLNKAARIQRIRTCSPESVGPGSYNPQMPEKKIGTSIKGKNQPTIHNGNPSPADYNVQLKYVRKQCAFPKEKRKIPLKDGPGPSHYLIKNLNRTYGSVFGKESRNNNYSHSQLYPGPANYQNTSVKLLKNIPEIAFSHEQRFKEEEYSRKLKKRIPGVGSYDLETKINVTKGGKFLKSSRNQEQLEKKLIKPGPGSYNLTLSHLNSSVKHKFTESPRVTTEMSKTPGPGKYDSVDLNKFMKKNGNPIFSYSSRKHFIEIDTPGPGSYDCNTQFSEDKGPKISGRFATQIKENSPGPQKYSPEPKLIQPSSISSTIGKQARLKTQKIVHPGPGKYNLSTKQKGQSFLFPRTKRNDLKNNNIVGPGEYKLKPYLGMYDGKKKNEKQILYV